MKGVRHEKTYSVESVALSLLEGRIERKKIKGKERIKRKKVRTKEWKKEATKTAG